MPAPIKDKSQAFDVEFTDCIHKIFSGVGRDVDFVVMHATLFCLCLLECEDVDVSLFNAETFSHINI